LPIRTIIHETSPRKRIPRQILLCPFPEVARYKATGDPNSADNFVCVGREE
jgi:hypothetical protein